MKVIMFIKTDIGKEENVLGQLRRIKEIEQSYIVYGPWDIVIVFTVQKREEIYRLRNERIRRIRGAHQTMTLMCF